MSRRSRSRVALATLGVGLACVLGLAPRAVTAHPLAPALLELRETGPGQVAVRFKTSLRRLPGARIEPRLPASCTRHGEPERRVVGTSLTERFALVCSDPSLVGAEIGMDGLERGRIDALLRVELRDGRQVQTVLRPGSPRFVVPERTSRLDVATSYARLGIEHIASGLDHLLFVFGLLLLVGGALGGVVRTVTAFTLGHSVTLSLAVLGFVRFPSGWIELLIAVSILALAVELARPPDAAPSRLRRRPWAMSAGFGLLHGLGFAGALAEVGLPPDEIPVSLAAFNVGIEIGQLVFVLGVLLLWRLLRPGLGSLPAWSRAVPVYALGALAAYWCIERATELVS